MAVKQNGRRISGTLTITAGTPIPLASGAEPIMVDRFAVQMLAGGSGLGLVYDDVPPNTAPADIAAACGAPWQLRSATANNPGGSYEDRAESFNGIDLRTIAVDGTVTGDLVKFSAQRIF